MKCIKPSEKGVKKGLEPAIVTRVTNIQAAKAVKSGHWEYTDKAAWKAAGRH